MVRMVDFRMLMCRWILFCCPSVFVVACSSTEEQSTTGGAPHIQAASTIEAGRYLAIVAGCNDCHTHGYLQTEGDVPEEQWLAGSGLGWRGPWGTTYASNLRLSAQTLSEESWVQVLQTRTELPPMPWMNTNRMSAADARALHAYIRSLGPLGEPVPEPIPPDQEPSTAYLSLTPVEP